VPALRIPVAGGEVTAGEAGARSALLALGTHPDQPAATRALLVELALEPVLADLALAPAARAAGPAAIRLGLSLAWPAGGAAVFGLTLDAAAAASLAGRLAARPAARRPVPDLPVPLRLRTLAAAPAPGEALLVAGERLAWRARRQGRALRLLGPRGRLDRLDLEGFAMTAPSDAVADPASDLDDLPVRLVFEAGRVEVPLAELESLGEGHVFELGRDPGSTVDILANGRRIGAGEIVEVGGALGVRVLWIGRHG
jgi:type III secretion protein Q